MKRLWKKTSVVESFPTAMLLGLVGGYLDIYTYLARGKVFANTQTGNLVLLGYHIAIANFSKATYYLLAILAFIVGIILAKVVEHNHRENAYFDWRHIVMGIEIVVLFIVMYIPQGEWNVVANMMISFVCALQVQSFRKVNGYAYSTIMFTGNLKNIGDHIGAYWLTKDQEALDKGLLYLAITIMFIMGGWLGALTTMAYEQKAIGIINVVLIIIFALLLIEKRKEKIGSK